MTDLTNALWLVGILSGSCVILAPILVWLLSNHHPIKFDTKS